MSNYLKRLLCFWFWIVPGYFNKSFTIDFTEYSVKPSILTKWRRDEYANWLRCFRSSGAVQQYSIKYRRYYLFDVRGWKVPYVYKKYEKHITNKQSQENQSRVG